ncbi:ATP-binding mismatch repair protein [Phytophthora boehmeriae]|uniref:ATP-binding mismatch repair protein n=1 Tax=Phytophthora boehmeriae TaxID=109152 RepID=A0A8T1X4F4_9STRA|nr:ATP-binding mismatch repair protein [Phytophthora boehmeriae]
MSALDARSPSALHVLDRRDVQRICSGQSVVDLATAVKELVENALDAGASQIEVKLKEFGRDAFEVSDNGAGVAAENFQALAKKHYTSKISSFEDIESVASFGFRGEALSSICELASSFSVCTRTKDEAVGALLEYDSSGELKKATKKARPVGTTVTVEELFKPLAVRHKDFHRNVKKHYAKLLKVLQAYAVSCSNVKICVFNITGKNANRNVVLATQAHQTMGENIANVFGTKFFRTLLRVEFELRGQPKLEDGNKPDESNEAGNSDDEKLIPADTQDKRETFIKNEAEIIDAFKTNLTKLYEPSRGTFTVQPLMTTFARADKTEQTEKTSENSLVSPSPQKDDTTAKLKRIPAVEQLEEDSDISVRSPSHREESQEATDESVSQEPPHAVIVEVLEPRTQRSCSANQTPEIHKKHDEAANPPSSSNTRAASPDPVVLDLRRPAKKQKLYPPPEFDATPTQDDHEWSLEEMMKQRQRFFGEVEQEQKRKQHRLKVPKACSTSPGGDALKTDNEVAAAALQRVLKKEDFKRMEVLGQFNLGFIIGKLDNDLFIIDQHASDEKFNYETLQQTTVMHQQPLVRPLLLEVTAGEEMTILDHLDVFAKNGFTFQVNKEAPATKKLKLLSLPFTKHTQFGTEDIRELASLLTDAPLNPSTIRLPKVMAMFASRACRSSIMIGTALHKEEMQRIVRNLSGLDQPWNCPHGRPTLRHLVDLMHLEDSEN